jgi:ComF family protein
VDFALASATARRLVEPVLSVVFPSACPACGRLVARPGTGPLCDRCWDALPRHLATTCRCGLPTPGGPGPCGRCRRGRQPFAAGASLGPYEGTLKQVLHALKYGGRRRAANRLARALLDDPAPRLLVATSDILVPVPLHPRRLRERGFNQSALLAAELGRLTGRPALAGALVRRRDTVPQAGLSAAERRRNVRDAFVVRRRGPVMGRIVTLVDDVFTTGATAYACARALRSAGASEVRLVTVARVA